MHRCVYVWEFPVRLVHFLNWWTVGILSFTGFCIGTPFIHEISQDYLIMSWVRMVHAVAAYVFITSFLIRAYWFFAGNYYASWRGMLPLSREAWRDLYDTVLFYAFVTKKAGHPHPGHNALASLSYLGLFFLFFAEIVTGFALYSQAHTGGLWTLLGGWMLRFVNPAAVRLTHHLVMWCVVIFVSAHFYIAWENDSREINAAKSSIFSGYKYVDDEK
jgi:Ni/Fe-hydrogenase 1 B-type cytochrome subunit